MVLASALCVQDAMLTPIFRRAGCHRLLARRIMGIHRGGSKQAGHGGCAARCRPAMAAGREHQRCVCMWWGPGARPRGGGGGQAESSCVCDACSTRWRTEPHSHHAASLAFIRAMWLGWAGLGWAGL